jgi:hypothetical protein
VFVFRFEGYRFSEKNNFYQSVAIHNNNLEKKGLNTFENLSNEILPSPKYLPYSITIMPIFFGHLYRRDKAEC